MVRKKLCDFRIESKPDNAVLAFAGSDEMRNERIMAKIDRAALSAWVEANRKKKNLSQRALGELIGRHQTSVSRAINLQGVPFTWDEIVDMGNIFGQHFPLVYDEVVTEVVASERKSTAKVTLGEKITLTFAGTRKMQSHVAEISPNTRPRWIDVPQEAMEIEGGNGRYILVVNYFDFNHAPQVGDEVVVKQYHPGLFRHGDLSLSWNTIRTITKVGGKIVLKSENPMIEDIEYNPDDKSTIITKLIIGDARFKD